MLKLISTLKFWPQNNGRRRKPSGHSEVRSICSRRMMHKFEKKREIEDKKAFSAASCVAEQRRKIAPLSIGVALEKSSENIHRSIHGSAGEQPILPGTRMTFFGVSTIYRSSSTTQEQLSNAKHSGERGRDRRWATAPGAEQNFHKPRLICPCSQQSPVIAECSRVGSGRGTLPSGQRGRLEFAALERAVPPVYCTSDGRCGGFCSSSEKIVELFLEKWTGWMKSVSN